MKRRHREQSDNDEAMVPPPPIIGPTPAQIPVLPRVGFDILAENIHAVHRYVQPSHKTNTGGAVLAVGRTIRSAFTLGAGKRSVSGGERDGRGDDGTTAVVILNGV
jgi:hypothetical protein